MPVTDESVVPRGQRRAANKNRRIQTILDAARSLIRESESTEFTMHQLAERAGFSLATTYNLIGTKGTVLYALLSTSLAVLADDQAAIDHSDAPVQRIERTIDLAVSFFTDDPGYHRPLMRFLLGNLEPRERPLFMAQAVSFWRISTQPLRPALRTDIGVRIGDIARAIHISFVGALDLWIHDEIDKAAFGTIVRQGAFLVILSATQGFAGELEARLRKIADE